MPSIVEEEANRGDAGGSGGEAGGGVFGGDAAEGEDGDVSGGVDGGAEGVEALAGDFLAVGRRWRGDDFFKYRSVEDEGVGGGGVGVAL